MTEVKSHLLHFFSEVNVHMNEIANSMMKESKFKQLLINHQNGEKGIWVYSVLPEEMESKSLDKWNVIVADSWTFFENVTLQQNILSSDPFHFCILTVCDLDGSIFAYSNIYENGTHTGTRGHFFGTMDPKGSALTASKQWLREELLKPPPKINESRMKEMHQFTASLKKKWRQKRKSRD